MAHRALLLDFDGVVLRNQKVKKYVEHCCTKLLSHKVNIPYKTARQVNQQLYPVYGHTSFIINRDYNVPCSMEQFNDTIYNEYINYKYIEKLLSFEDVAYAKQFERLVSTWNPDTVFIFSNATDVWCANILLMVGLGGLIPGTNMLCSNLLKALKPSYNAYAEAESQARLLIPTLSSFVFVDDHANNLLPVKDFAHWHTFHYTADNTPESLHKYLETIDSNKSWLLSTDKTGPLSSSENRKRSLTTRNVQSNQ